MLVAGNIAGNPAGTAGGNVAGTEVAGKVGQAASIEVTSTVGKAGGKATVGVQKSPDTFKITVKIGKSGPFRK